MDIRTPKVDPKAVVQRAPDEADVFETHQWSGNRVDVGTTGAIKLQNAGLDEIDGQIIAHGWIDIESINRLRVAPYQREVLERVGNKRTSLAIAVNNAVRLPDIMLGMRGENVTFPKGTSFCLLHDEVYIIDGLQRIFALKSHVERNPDGAKKLRIGAEVRFNTTKDSERELFLVLNTSRIPVSPNVVLRNLRETHKSILTLYGLSMADKDFPLYQRVSWSQRMGRGELVTAQILTRIAKALHGFANVTNPRSVGSASRSDQLANALDAVVDKVGMQTFRRNMSAFFELVDTCWGIRTVQYTERNTQLKGNFLVTLARLLCDHTNFWKLGTDELFVGAIERRKLAAFPVLDPEIARLAGAGSMTQSILLELIIEHMDKGKKLHRLKKRTDNK